MKRNLEAQYKELEEKRRVFEDEKANWEAQQRILEQQKLDASKLVLTGTVALIPYRTPECSKCSLIVLNIFTIFVA